MKKKLVDLLNSIKSPSILVVGDLMLDKYTFGTVSRISPEAPIPVLHVTKEEFKPGGALNVVNNLRALDCKVGCVGVIGDDEFGLIVKDKLANQKVEMKGIVVSTDRPTTLKNRMLGGFQQLLRVDYERSSAISTSTENEIIEKLDLIMNDYELIIVSDYNKGVLTSKILQSLITKAKQLNIPIICDPRNDVDYSIYRGMTLIKPNRSEAERVVGHSIRTNDDMVRASRRIVEETDVTYLTMSLDKDGIFLCTKNFEHEIFPTETREVFDVTGAGDIVISTIGYVLAGGYPVEAAVKLANIAAGIEITRLGVCSVSKDEMINELLSDEAVFNRKLKSLEELKSIVDKIKSANASVILTNGYFDELQVEHIKFLQALKRYSGTVIVGINSDKSIYKLKGRYPRMKGVERAQMLSLIEIIDYITIFDDKDATNLIQTVKPDVYVKGKLSSIDKIVEKDLLINLGCRIELVEDVLLNS